MMTPELVRQYVRALGKAVAKEMVASEKRLRAELDALRVEIELRQREYRSDEPLLLPDWRNTDAQRH